MDFSTIAFNLFLVLFFTLLNGFFVAAEFAIVKIRPTRLEELVQAGRPRATVAHHICTHLDAYLSACQLGITLASLALGALGEPAIATLIEPGLHGLGLSEAAIHSIAFGIAFATITILHIVLGELAPKSLAIRKAEGTTLAIAVPLRLFNTLFYPFIWVLNALANQLLHLIGIHPVTEHESVHTQEEIRILMKESAKTGVIDTEELTLFNRMFRFSDRRAREVMVPRVDMVCLDRNAPFDEVLAVAEQEGHTRYPVCDGGKDAIVGFVHIRDLFTGKPQELGPLIREALTVPGNLEISDLLRQMQKTKSHMAIVFDEYGGTAGLLTIEDILEEIVGDIQDEFDDERPKVEKMGDSFSLDGGLPLEEVNEALGVRIEAGEDSLGGWIYSLLGRAPKKGDVVETSEVRFEVAEVSHLRIVRVTAWVKDGPA
ncbi:MAG: HlyC/CorC family transporter [Candidatus Sericytochromatia bacterium]|nr:HlyC/CorC family transporter [Candidatus Tanganyikabacteria bacterium]